MVCLSYSPNTAGISEKQALVEFSRISINASFDFDFVLRRDLDSCRRKNKTKKKNTVSVHGQQFLFLPFSRH